MLRIQRLKGIMSHLIKIYVVCKFSYFSSLVVKRLYSETKLTLILDSNSSKYRSSVVGVGLTRERVEFSICIHGPISTSPFSSLTRASLSFQVLTTNFENYGPVMIVDSFNYALYLSVRPSGTRFKFSTIDLIHSTHFTGILKENI